MAVIKRTGQSSWSSSASLVRLGVKARAMADASSPSLASLQVPSCLSRGPFQRRSSSQRFECCRLARAFGLASTKHAAGWLSRSVTFWQLGHFGFAFKRESNAQHVCAATLATIGDLGAASTSDKASLGCNKGRTEYTCLVKLAPCASFEGRPRMRKILSRYLWPSVAQFSMKTTSKVEPSSNPARRKPRRSDSNAIACLRRVAHKCGSRDPNRLLAKNLLASALDTLLARSV